MMGKLLYNIGLGSYRNTINECYPRCIHGLMASPVRVLWCQCGPHMETMRSVWVHGGEEAETSSLCAVGQSLVLAGHCSRSILLLQ